MGKKIIIAITGKMASGKGYVSEYLGRTYGIAPLSSSFALYEALDVCALPRSRENFQTLALFLSSQFGDDTLGKAVERRIGTVSQQVVALNGVRREGDIEPVKKVHHVCIWFIDADDPIRYERYRSRNQYYGDDEMTFEDFTLRDNAQTEQKQGHFKSLADKVIFNNGTFSEFERKLDRAYRETIDRYSLRDRV